MNLKRVLINDPDEKVVRELSEILLRQGGSFDVLTATDGAEALEILRRTPVDLLITSLHFKNIDGFQLLAEVNFRHKNVKVIVMLDAQMPLPRVSIRYMGADAAFRKPLNMAELTERIYVELQMRIRGEVWGLNLASFLQLLNTELKTCCVTVTKLPETGRLYLLEGDLIEAETGDKRGDEALYAIMGWDDINIEIDYIPFNKKRNVSSGLMSMLMESQRRKDEERMALLQQRAHSRFSCLVAVDFDYSDLQHKHLIRDMSAGGAFVESNVNVSVNDEIELRLQAMKYKTSCTIRARVARLATGGFGVQFLDMDDEKKAFLQSLQG